MRQVRMPRSIATTSETTVTKTVVCKPSHRSGHASMRTVPRLEKSMSCLYSQGAAQPARAAQLRLSQRGIETHYPRYLARISSYSPLSLMLARPALNISTSSAFLPFMTAKAYGVENSSDSSATMRMPLPWLTP